MESAHEAALKVCPHCSVATRTDADVCPSCGGSYVRGGRPRLRWSWWFAIPIVAAAFLIGYFGISQLVDDDDSEGITVEQAKSVPVPAGISRVELSERLDANAQTVRAGQRTCSSYTVTDGPNPGWLFCFQDDKLVASRPIPPG